MASEQTYFNENNIVVTNARFITREQTFAMGQVSAVRAAADPWFRMNWVMTGGVGLGVFGLGAMLLLSVLTSDVPGQSTGCPLFTLACGAVLLALGVYFYFQRYYAIVVATSGGNISALKSKDPKFILRVVAALNEALIARG